MKKDKPVFVYAIERHGDIKIGFSCDPWRRLLEIAPKSHHPRIVAVVLTDDPRGDEKLLHWILRNRSKSGHHSIWAEWFRVDEALVVELFQNLDKVRADVEVPPNFSIHAFRRGGAVYPRVN